MTRHATSRRVHVLALVLLATVFSAPPQASTRLVLVDMLRAGAFSDLDRVLRETQARYEAGESSEETVENSYFAFANSSPDLAARLGEWVKAEPGAYTARLARAVYYWNLGLLARGARRGALPQTTRYARMRVYFARCAMDTLHAIGTNPRVGFAYGLLIRIATELGNDADVLRITRIGLKADPRSFIVRRRYLDSLRPWWQKDSGDAGVAFARINAFVDAIRAERASNPDLAVLQGYVEFVRADLLARRGKRALARDYYDRALQFGAYWAYLYRRGINHFRLGEHDMALRDFDHALDLRPQATEILNMRARALRALGRIDDALADWKLALALNPYDPLVLLQEAYGLRQHKRIPEAIAALDRAMQFGAQNEYIWDARGRMYLYDLEDFGKASSDLERATELNPASTKYWFNYALALFKSGDCGAMGALTRYLELCVLGGCPEESTAWAGGMMQRMSQDDACLH